jgi:flagellin
MAVRNANDGVSLLQTAEGAMVEQTNMLQRMRELAVQASSDTVTTTDKASIDLEFQALLSEVDRIGGNTQWNGANVLDASGGGNTAGTYVFQVGANQTQSISVAIGNMSSTGILTAVDGLAVTSSASAGSAISMIDSAISAMALQRAQMGAGMNRLTYAADNLANVAQNATESRSRILDTDYATATTALSRSQIISQAATAMLAQANQQPQSVLALLK